MPFQVRSVTDEIKLFQSGSVFYECTKLTGGQYEHRVNITVDGLKTTCQPDVLLHLEM